MLQCKKCKKIFPENNEKEFITVAKKLGYTSLCFVYTLKNFKNKKYDLDIKYGILASEKEIKKAKNLSNRVFVKASENSRNLLEKTKDIILFDFEKMKINKSIIAKTIFLISKVFPLIIYFHIQ